MADEKDKIKKVNKNISKSANTFDKKKNPVITAKDTLNTISGLPNIDVDDLINNLLKNTQDSVINSVDFKDIYRALSSDDKNSDINNIIKNISSLDFITSSSQLERINKYKDFIQVLKRVPVVKKILRLYTSNILAPDDVSKISLKIVPRNASVNKGTEEYISIENKFKVILDKIDLENHLYDLVFKTLFYGDVFIEILSSKRYLLQTIYNLQLPINDANIKLNEDLCDPYLHNDVGEFDFIPKDYNSKGNIQYHVEIDWAKPIMNQLSETTDFANSYFNSILNYFNINENNLHRYRNNGFLNYLAEEFYGSNEILKDKEKFRVFHEAFVESPSMVPLNNPDNPYNVYNGNNYSSSYNDNSDEDAEELLNKKYSLDYLPIQSTLSALNIKIHMPDKIIVLKDNDIEYGYLYVDSGLESLNSINSANSAGGSQISTNAIGSTSIMETSNFLNNSSNRLGMFGSGNTTQQVLSHSKQITNKIAEYIRSKFEEYSGDVNIENMSTHLQTLIADILNSGSTSINIRYIPPLNMQQIKIEGTGLNSPYGESITENLLYRAKMLMTEDVNNAISKYTNTGKRLKWTVTANTTQQANNKIQQLIKAVNKKTVAVDNYIDLMSSAIFQNDSIYLARVNGENLVDVETLDLGSAQDNTDSNNYQIKQLITGEDIPPAHLGYEEWTSGKNTLATESVVFAQSIISYQKQLGVYITSLIHKIYLAIYSYTNEFNVNYKNLLLAFNSPRGITLSACAENMNNLSTIFNTITDGDLDIDKKVVINMFWPELYDQLNEANLLIKQLNKDAKQRQLEKVAMSQKNNANDENNGTGGDFLGSGGMDFGSSGDLSGGTDMSTSDLENMADATAAGAEMGVQ